MLVAELSIYSSHFDGRQPTIVWRFCMDRAAFNWKRCAGTPSVVLYHLLHPGIAVFGRVHVSEGACQSEIPYSGTRQVPLFCYDFPTLNVDALASLLAKLLPIPRLNIQSLLDDLVRAVNRRCDAMLLRATLC